MPSKTCGQVAAILNENGFDMVGQKGSHQKWVGPNGERVILPWHGKNSGVPTGTLGSIIRQSGLDRDCFSENVPPPAAPHAHQRAHVAAQPRGTQHG